MSFVTAHDGLVFIGSGDFLQVFNIGNEMEPLQSAFDAWDQIDEKLVQNPDFEKEKSVKKDEKTVILCLSHSNVSNNRRLLALGTNKKQIHVIEYFTDDNGQFLRSEHVITAIVPKAPTAVAFDREDAYIIIGDRAGDVYRFSIAEGKAVEMAGAISMILDVGFTPSGRQLLMTDRDEKLRVMRYPETYVIDAYCLGHTEYVKTMACVAEDNVWSAGGDKIILNWSITDSTKPRVTVDLSEYEKAIRKIVFNAKFNRLAVLLEGSDRLILIDVTSSPPQKSVFQVCREGEYLDLAEDGDHFVVLGRSSILTVNAGDLSYKHVQLNEQLAVSLKNTQDAVSNLYKNVTHNNQAEYEKRKAEKFEQIEQKKRKVGGSAVTADKETFYT